MHDYYRRNVEFFRSLQNVCFYATDPGSWAVLKILSEFLDQRGHRCFLMPEGWALKQVSRDWKSSRIIAPDEWKNSYRPMVQLLVYGAQQRFDKNYAMLSRCKEMRIETLFVFDSWKNYLVNFRDPRNGTLYLPSRIAVADQVMKEGVLSALARYTAENLQFKIDILGQPAVAASVAYIEALAPHDITSLRERYNSSRKKLNLFVMEPIREDFLQVNRTDPGYDEYTVFKYFLDHCCEADSETLVKIHPRQKMEEVLREVTSVASENGKVSIRIEQDEKIEHLIAIADEVYGMTSTALTVAIRSGKKTFSLQPGRNEYGRTLSNPELEQRLVDRPAYE